jgi:hypothetical protein
MHRTERASINERAVAREALTDVLWGYVTSGEASVIAEEVLDVLPGLIRQHPLAFGLGVEYLPGGAFNRVVGQWVES